MKWELLDYYVFGLLLGSLDEEKCLGMTLLGSPSPSLDIYSPITTMQI